MLPVYANPLPNAPQAHRTRRAVALRRTALALLLTPLVALLALACGADDDPAPAATETPTASVAATATAAPRATATPQPPPAPTATPAPPPRPEANPFPADLEQEARRWLGEIGELRGMPPLRDVDMFLMSREQARAFYARDPAGGGGEPRFDPKQEVYELLGLVPPRAETGRDVEEEQLDNLISLITGFYSPRHDAFYMIETISGGIYGNLARSTIAHELTHALQYQYTDIDAIAGQRSGNWDATAALLAVLEGDAVNTELQLLGYSTRTTFYREPACFTIPAPQRSGTPFVVERELDFWYEEGLCFVQAVLEAGRDIASVFADMPASTSEILHPQKYLEGRGPVEVTPQGLATALGGEWSRLTAGRLGEFGLQNLLLLGLVEDRPAVQAAAAGWAGDAWAIYGAGEARLFHLRSVWDNEAEARGFLDGLARSLGNRGAAPQTPAAEGSLDVAIGATAWRAAVQGNAVTLLVASEAEAAARAWQALGLP